MKVILAFTVAVCIAAGARADYASRARRGIAFVSTSSPPAASPPTIVNSYSASGNGVRTVGVGGISWSAGNVIVVVGTCSDNTDFPYAAANPNLTFTRRVHTLSGGANSQAAIWTAVAGSNQSSQSVTTTDDDGSGGGRALTVFVLSGASSDFSNAVSSTGSGTTISRTITTASTSLVLGGMQHTTTGAITVNADTTSVYSVAPVSGATYHTHGKNSTQKTSHDFGGTIASSTWVAVAIEIKSSG